MTAATILPFTTSSRRARRRDDRPWPAPARWIDPAPPLDEPDWRLYGALSIGSSRHDLEFALRRGRPADAPDWRYVPDLGLYLGLRIGETVDCASRGLQTLATRGLAPVAPGSRGIGAVQSR